MAAPSVKQHLAAIRMLFDFLVTGQVVPMNPASSVRGPKHVVRRGKTPVLKADQARTLLDSIKTDSIVGLRDRAIIGVMCCSFACLLAMVHMRVEDYYQNGSVGGSVSMRRAASATRCRRTTTRKRTSTRTSMLLACGKKEIVPGSGRRQAPEPDRESGHAHRCAPYGEAPVSRSRASLHCHRDHGTPSGLKLCKPCAQQTDPLCPACGEFARMMPRENSEQQWFECTACAAAMDEGGIDAAQQVPARQQTLVPQGHPQRPPFPQVAYRRDRCPA